MDLQKLLNNAMAAKRAEEMKTSPQLMLGELILHLEAVQDKTQPVTFDVEGYKPTGLGSWRGSYSELAIQYEGAQTCFEQPKPDCQMDEFGYHYYKCHCGGSNAHSTALPDNPTVADLLAILRLANGKYFEGYKGGDFTMGKTTPVWVANYGTSSGFKTDGDKYCQAVIGVSQGESVVVIDTRAIDY